MKDSKSRSIRIQAERGKFREHSVPIYMTSSFIFEDMEQGRALFADEIPGNIYSRFSNPNTTELTQKMTDLEEMEDGVTFASGMAALFAVFAGLLQAGDHVIASRALFGSTLQIFNKILGKWGISTTLVDGSRSDEWKTSIQKNTRMIFAETPSNPGLEIIDLEFLGELCKEHHLIFHVDNTFATPYLQNPSRYGADVISHSATKYLDGQGRLIGGIVVGRKNVIEQIRFFARHTGPTLSAFNAWLISKSLETLPVRMERHCRNAERLAEILVDSGLVQNVRYPFHPAHPDHDLARRQMKAGGGIITFEIMDGFAGAERFVNSLEMCSVTANLGDTRTIVTHPASTTHSKLSEEERQKVGITQGLIRVSTGLEEIDDIASDIISALNTGTPNRKRKRGA
jgi:O-succinylhomoserine sulfhydrylase